MLSENNANAGSVVDSKVFFSDPALAFISVRIVYEKYIRVYLFSSRLKEFPTDI
jgi:hypothetical protein